MKTNLFRSCIAALTLGVSTSASAITQDFESTATGIYTELIYADYSIVAEDGRSFDVKWANPGPPVSGHSLITWLQNGFQTKLTVIFTLANVTSFSIGAGDFNGDVDNTFLELYDANWNLIGSDSYVNPADMYGGDYLSATTDTAIKYAVFWDGEPFAGALYWDNLSYSQGASRVPDSSTTLPLLGAGLVVLASLRRKIAA